MAQLTSNKVATLDNRVKLVQKWQERFDQQAQESARQIQVRDDRIASLENRMNGLMDIITGEGGVLKLLQQGEDGLAGVRRALAYHYRRIVYLHEVTGVEPPTGYTPDQSMASSQDGSDNGEQGDFEEGRGANDSFFDAFRRQGDEFYEPPVDQRTRLQRFPQVLPRAMEPPQDNQPHEEKDQQQEPPTTRQAQPVVVTQSQQEPPTVQQAQAAATTQDQGEPSTTQHAGSVEALQDGRTKLQEQAKESTAIPTELPQVGQVGDTANTAPNELQQEGTMQYVTTASGLLVTGDGQNEVSSRQSQVAVQAPAPPKQVYKPPMERCNVVTQSPWRDTFEGKPQERIEMFIRSFETFCMLNEIPPEQMCKRLWLHLRGHAQEVVADMPDETNEHYKAMKVKLLERFGKGDRRSDAKSRLENTHYRQGVGAMEFISEVMGLLEKAYPDDSTEVRNVRTYETVKDKLPQDFRVEMIRREVKTLAGLKENASIIEELTKELGRPGVRMQMQPVNATFMEPESTNAGIVGSAPNAPEAPRPSPWDRATPPRYKAGRNGVNRSQTQQDVRRTQGFRQGQPQVQRSQSFGRQNQAQQAVVICGFCGKSGHAQINCWMDPNSQAFRPGYGRGGGQVRQVVMQPRRQQAPFQPQQQLGYQGRPQLGYQAQPQFGYQERQQLGYQALPQIGYQAQPQMGYQQRQPQQAIQANCYACGNPGHFSRNCPNRQVQVGNTPQNVAQLATRLATMAMTQQQGAMHNQQVNQVMEQQPQAPSVQQPPNLVQTVTIAQQGETKQVEEKQQERVYTQEDLRKFETELTFLKNQFFRRQDREEPVIDLVTTLSRHEDGKTPAYVPPDFRMVILPVKVNNIRIAALLDTGSSVTLGPIAMAQALGIETEPSDKAIRSMTGHTETAPRKAQIELTMAGHKRRVSIHFTSDALWTNNPYDVIIGGDSMQEFPKCTVDFGKREFTMGENAISWKTKAEVMLEERKVFLVQDVTIPAGQEMLVNALIDSSKGKVNSLVTIVEAKEQQVQVIESLTDVDQENRCKVLLANPTDSPIKIRRYTVVGKACNVVDDSAIPQEYPEITASSVEDFSRRNESDPTYVVDYSRCQCNEEQVQQLKATLESYGEQFSRNGYDLGMAKVNPMQIRTTTEEPYRPSIYNVDRGMREKVSQELEKMQEMGCIRESNTPWLSPLVMVKKKNGEMRPCIDLRKLNAITVPDYYPIPMVHDALDKVGKSYWLSSLDLNKGFWQLPLSQDASWKCGVISNDRVYQCLTMPFGLRNAPSAFMRAMRTVLGPLWDKCVVYIDDVVIMTREDDFGQHLKDIAAVLERFKEFNIKVNPKKCEFARREITFLGHNVSKDGYKPDERNVVKIKELPVPTTQAQVRHCLGVFSFFRRLIKDFAHIASPLTALCGKNAGFEWSDECQKAFETLKEKLTAEPMLAFPDDKQEYHLMVDASAKAIGVALTQKQDGIDRPISFYSRALSKAEQKRPAVQLELMAIIEGLRWCRYFIYGKQVVVHTDHRPLLHLMEKRTTHANLARWLIELQQYDNVTIQHMDGKRNTLADALSRWEELTQGRPVTELQDGVRGAFGLDTDGDVQVGEKAQCNVVWVMQGKTVKDCQAEDKVLSQAIKAIQDKVDPSTITDAELKWHVEKCELNDNGTLVLKEQDRKGHRVFVPKAFQRAVFDQFHGSKIGGGHMNARATQDKMREFAWRGMPRDVAEWHKRCYQCQTRAPKRSKVPPVMTRLTRPFEKMGLDVCGPLHITQDGNLHYLACIDWFTKYVVTVAIPDTKCRTVVDALWENVILRYGCPLEIVTDNATTFSAEFFREVMEMLGIKKSYCTPHHSDGNAITERMFRTFHDMIAKYASSREPKEENREWDRILPIATFAYNVTRHSTTGETPFMLMFGRDPIFPIQVTLQESRQKPREAMSVKQFRAELVKLVEGNQERAAQEFSRAADKIKEQADKACRESDIAEGELVLYRDYSLRVGVSSKFKNLWRDVFRVRKLEDQHAWIVPTTSPNEAGKKVHLNQIKRFYPEQDGEDPQPETATKPRDRKRKAGSRWKERKEERKKEVAKQEEKRAERDQDKIRGAGTKYGLRQKVRRRDAAPFSA